jgi:glycosyltransferase involved in cell wall biosynthesis
MMSALDVLAIASSFGEALSLVVLEAASLGVHIVTTDVGDNHTLMLDDRLVAVRSDARSLSNAMSHAAAMIGTYDGSMLLERRKALVRERYSLGRTVRLYEELYRKLAARKP